MKTNDDSTTKSAHRCHDSRNSLPVYHFSLIELLVVIAIIGLLISMLMPALKKARDAGYSTQCKSNQRQCGLGLANYANDFDSWIVPANANDVGYIVDGYMNTLGGMMMTLGYAPRQGSNPGWQWWKIGWPNLFACPSLPVPSAGYKWAGGVRKQPMTVYSYGLRSLHADSCYPDERLSSTGRLIKINSVYQKCPFIVDGVYDWTGDGGVITEGQYHRSIPSYDIHLRHSKHGNVWLVDGHVESWDASEVDAVLKPGAGTFSSNPLTYRY